MKPMTKKELEGNFALAIEALIEARFEAHMTAHSEFDGVWNKSDFDALTPKADALLRSLGYEI